MTFVFTIIFVSLYYIRPFEIIESMRGMPVLLIVGGIAFASFVKDVISRQAKLFNNGTDQMMVGFFLAIVLSHVSSFYFGGALKSAQVFLPTFIGYFLVAHSINTERKLNIFIFVIISCTVFLALEGIIQSSYGVSYFGVYPLEQIINQGHEGQQSLYRIKWIGTFADPNDLAMALTVAVPFLVRRILLKNYLIPLFLLSLICYAVYLTQSRGGILALLASISAYLVLRYRSKRTLAWGIIVMIPLLLVATKMRGAAMDESSYGRLEAWYEGYQMFKNAPVFGVGQGMFTDVHNLTAHNSLVLVFSELGLLGAFFFVGMFYYPLSGIYRYLTGGIAIKLDGTESIFHAAWAGMIGMLVAMFFLSRSYVFLPFMMVGLSVAAISLDATYPVIAACLKKSPGDFKRITVATICGIVGINIFIKIFL